MGTEAMLAGMIQANWQKHWEKSHKLT